MSIKHIELFHGAVLSKITRNKKNKISLIEWNEEENRSLYKIETESSSDLSILIKYDASARSKKRDQALAWDFNNIPYIENCYYCFVCIEEKIIIGDVTMEICAIPPEKTDKFFLPNEETTSCVVSLSKGKSFRVERKKKGMKITISRNQIERI